MKSNGRCHYSNETSLAPPLHGAICFWYVTKWNNFFLKVQAPLIVKGLNKQLVAKL